MSTLPLFSKCLGTTLFFVLVGITIQLYAQECPLTTNSNEAQTFLVEGRELFDNLRSPEARALFEKALQQDPDFALANLYGALSAANDGDFVKHLSKAVNQKCEVSNGERLFIESVKANSDRQTLAAINQLKIPRIYILQINDSASSLA